MGYNITLTRNKDYAVLNKAKVVSSTRNKNDHNPWYVPHYTPSIPQQGILS